MTKRPDAGVRREVSFKAWCGLCGWNGTSFDMKSMAAYDMAQHLVNRHSARQSETQSLSTVAGLAFRHD